jgi:hypothetical protein
MQAEIITYPTPAKRMPSCIVSYCEQRSPEWFAIRSGVLTASQMGPWLVKNDKTSKKARHHAICRCLAELAGCESEPVFENWAMKRGTALEFDAVEHFHESTGLDVELVGFCLHESKAAGCSPDGLIVGQNVGYEGKAPVPETHVAYLLDGVLPAKYKEQVHGSMAVCGADGWWFQSFCPGLPTLRLLIKRDSYTEQVLDGIKRFAVELETARQRVAAMWNEQFAKEAR